MTKRELVVMVAERLGYTQNEVSNVVQTTLETITDCLARGQRLEIRNFGVFEVMRRKERVGRNPNEPKTEVKIPERAVVKFKPGKEMRKLVLKLDPQDLQ